MNKTVKITLITLGSVAGLAIIAVAVALWIVFTPARLTPIVNKQAARFVTCHAETDRVELTFFSTFPRLGLRADNLRLVNPVDGSPCDTLARFGRVRAAIDVRAFLRRDELILSDIELRDGTVCLFTDSLGRTNYDIVRSEPEAETDTAGLSIKSIDAGRVVLKNVDIVYIDGQYLMDVRLAGLSGRVDASMKDEQMKAAALLGPFDLAYEMGRADSLLALSMRGVELSIEGTYGGGTGRADVDMKPALLTLAYGGEEYFNDLKVALRTGASLDTATETVTLTNALLSLAGFDPAAIDGTVQNLPEGFLTDLVLKLGPWDAAALLALAPASMAPYLEGIDVAGNISAEGTVRGLYGEGSMPMFDLGVKFGDGRVAYPEMLPWPLRNVSADLRVHTDLEDAGSYMTVNSLRADAAASTFNVRGTVARLFSDPHANLSADLNADLADAAPFIPDDMALKMSGRASGRLTASASMSQLERMAFDEMKVGGSLLVSGLDALYDTIAIASPSAKVDFSLPNASPSTPFARFASIGISSGRLDASMGAEASAQAENLTAVLEISDIRDTLSIPGVVCDFSAGRLAGSYDDMKAAAASPKGKVTMSPSRRNAAAPRVKVRLGSGAIEASQGAENFSVSQLDLDATVVYDETKEDVWQMLSPAGFIVADGTVARLTSLNYPVEIPTLAADFNPNSVNVRNVRVKLDESDFSLRGKIDNISGYYRDGSILLAEFDFVSPVTNLTQLLALTSGIGTDEAADENAPAEAAPDEFTGPYMVPKGVDVTLHADINRALWYANAGEAKVFSDIRGDVRILDGVMSISPELSFRSPATDGQLEIIYRTPRKNHLFAGVGIHLERIEIQELVDLIPDLDSIMPMLRAFDGKGEFHLAFEGYMDSTYTFKISTLRGAASVAATDLTMKDDELFRKIAFLLKYKDEGLIRVDSLSAEFTVFRDEIDVYPFLLSVDRYKAVISGRHNLDMSFDYNISVVQSPLPFRMAVDVTGTPDDLKFKVFSKSRYPEFYRPPYRRAVENQQLELRNLIRAALTEKKTPE